MANRPKSLYDWEGNLGTDWDYSAKRRAYWRKVDSVVKASIQELVNAAIATLVSTTVEGLREILTQFEAELHVEDLDRALNQGIEGVLKSVAKDVQDSIVKSYAGLVTSREQKGDATHYRAGEGRLPYTLRRAISSADFVTVEGTELRVGNTAAMNKEARHWHRIAFGAGAAGGSGAVTSVDIVLGQQFTTLEIVEGPSPGFLMPPGRWLNGGENVGASNDRRSFFRSNPYGAHNRPRTASGDQFYPGGVPGWRGPKWIKTRGIVGRNFFAAGLNRLAEELPKQLTEMRDRVVMEWAKEHMPNQSKTIEARLLVHRPL